MNVCMYVCMYALDLAAINPLGRPLRDPCQPPLAFKSGGVAFGVLHVLNIQGTTDKEQGQVNALPISISQRKAHDLVALRPFGRPL
jgi:hypothetical protein